MENSNYLINRLLNLSIVLFGLIPLIPGSAKGFLVAILFIITLFSFFKSENKKLDYKSFIINANLYLFYLLSLTYSTNFSKGIKLITETRITALLLPIIFLLLSTNKNICKKEVSDKFKNVFIYSAFALSISYLIYLPFVKVSANPFFDFPSVYFFRNAIKTLPILGLDPIYYSLYLGIAIIFIFSREKIFKVFTMLMLITFIGILIAISSKMTILALFFILFVFLLKKVNLLMKFFVICSGIILLFLIFKVPTVNTRAKELLDKKTFIEYNRHNSTSIRVTILRCGYQVASENIFFGVGVGDVKEELISCYKSISNDLVYNRYNTHNQYLSILVGSGIFGLIFFFYFLYYNFKISNKSVDTSFYFILIFYCINFISENILERQNGIILFYFLVCYFSYFAINNNKKLVN